MVASLIPVIFLFLLFGMAYKMRNVKEAFDLKVQFSKIGKLGVFIGNYLLEHRIKNKNFN